MKSSETTAADRAYLKENKSNSFDCETKIKMVSDQLKEQKLNNTAKGSTDVLVENHSLLSFSTDGILQPESESEALACLISANYLNGYYAGKTKLLRLLIICLLYLSLKSEKFLMSSLSPLVLMFRKSTMTNSVM